MDYDDVYLQVMNSLTSAKMLDEQTPLAKKKQQQAFAYKTLTDREKLSYLGAGQSHLVVLLPFLFGDQKEMARFQDTFMVQSPFIFDCMVRYRDMYLERLKKKSKKLTNLIWALIPILAATGFALAHYFVKHKGKPVPSGTLLCSLMSFCLGGYSSLIGRALYLKKKHFALAANNFT